MTLGRLEKWRSEEESETAYYKRLLRKSPKQYSLLDFLADAFFKQADYEEAIHCWEKFLRKGTVKESFRMVLRAFPHLSIFNPSALRMTAKRTAALPRTRNRPIPTSDLRCEFVPSIPDRHR